MHIACRPLKHLEDILRSVPPDAADVACNVSRGSPDGVSRRSQCAPHWLLARQSQAFLENVLTMSLCCAQGWTAT